MKIEKVVKQAGLISLLALPLLMAPLAYAAQPTTATGTFTFSLAYTGSQTAGTNTISTFTGTTVDSGDLVGTLASTGTLVSHADGSANVQASGTYTGTALGSASGTMSFTFACQSIAGVFSCNVVFERGTGGLTGYHIQGIASGVFSSATAGAGTYAFQVTSNGS